MLYAGLSCCTGAARAQSPPTGGATLPTLVAPSTGPSGYGDPGTRSVIAAPTALVGDVALVRGTFPGAALRRAILQRFDTRRRAWRNVARTRVHRTDRFLVGWRPTSSGVASLRVVISHHAAHDPSAPVAHVNVYRPAQATYFGPSLYGRQTACGETLTPLLLGVAHRTLPCGTRVAILFDRREIIVPVVDRGPFNAGYDWDLTQATADALGFTDSGAIGYVRVTPAAVQPAAR